MNNLIDVNCCKLKDILESIEFNETVQYVGYIKIDVQGHEFECIIGALKTINKYRPIIMIEFDKKIINKIDKRLKKIGYLKFYFKADKIMLIKHKNEKETY